MCSTSALLRLRLCEMMTAMSIRPAQMDDISSIWRIIGPTIRAGETYALDREITELVGVRPAARVQFNFVVSTNTRTRGTPAITRV